jgi:hypothetical protein
MIKRWATWGGVLLVSDKTLVSIFSLAEKNKNLALLEELQPHVLVLDEAHTMVRNSKAKIFRTLTSITTPRKIGRNVEIVFLSPCNDTTDAFCSSFSALWISVSKQCKSFCFYAHLSAQNASNYGAAPRVLLSSELY